MYLFFKLKILAHDLKKVRHPCSRWIVIEALTFPEAMSWSGKFKPQGQPRQALYICSFCFLTVAIAQKGSDL